MINMERHVEEATTAGRSWRKENGISPRRKLGNDEVIPGKAGSFHHTVRRRRRKKKKEEDNLR